MSIVARLHERFKRQRAEAAQHLDRYHELMDADKADEAKTEREAFDAAMAAAEATKADLERAAKMDDLGDIKIIRSQRSTGPDTVRKGSPQQSFERDLTPPSQERMVERHNLLVDAMRGRSLSDEQTSALHRSWPVERLFPRVLADMARPTSGHLSSDQRTAWDEYGVQVRALGTHYTTVAGDGAEFVPTFLHSQIYDSLKHYGPLADDSLITVLRIGFGAKIDIPTANSLVKATVVGAGTDGTIDQQDTGDVNYTPHKYHKQVGIVSELMLDDYVNFETWVNGSVSEAFGGAFNDDRTLGNGTSKMTGAFAGTSSATNSHQIAANTSIAEEDVLAMLKLLDYAYQQLPGCRIMMHASTELDLMAQRKSGQRVYDLNPSTRRLILPRGLPYAVNNAFATARDSNTNKLIGIGDFGRYVSVYGGGMRVNSEYISRSDEFLLTWYVAVDGERTRDDAFRWIRGRA